MVRTESKRLLVTVTLALLATLVLFEITDLDRIVQGFFFENSSGGWIWDRHEPIGKAVLYDGARIVFFLYALGLTLALVFHRRLQFSSSTKHGLSVALLTAVLLPTLVGALKHLTDMPCPRAVDTYGGQTPFVHLLEPRPASSNGNHQCFPAGHASTGFALLALPLLAVSSRRRRLLVAGALVCGWTLGLYKMMIGDHFLSHTLVTMLLAVLVVHGLDVSLQRWTHKSASNPKNTGQRTLAKEHWRNDLNVNVLRTDTPRRRGQ